MQNTRRIFLKQAMLLTLGATVVSPALIRATEHIYRYYPEVEAVLSRFPKGLSESEREAITNFIISQVDCGNWQQLEGFHLFGFDKEENVMTNWIQPATKSNQI